MAVAGISILVYALSPPLVAWVFLRLGVTYPHPAIRVIYAPVLYLYEHFPPYKALMDAAFRALGVD